MAIVGKYFNFVTIPENVLKFLCLMIFRTLGGLLHQDIEAEKNGQAPP